MPEQPPICKAEIDFRPIGKNGGVRAWIDCDREGCEIETSVTSHDVSKRDHRTRRSRTPETQAKKAAAAFLTTECPLISTSCIVEPIAYAQMPDVLLSNEERVRYGRTSNRWR